MAARRLLPALGGSSAVWITCLVFFQTVLLLGYIYAHWLGRRTSARRAEALHTALLAIAATLLLFAAQPNLSRASDHPFLAIFQALSLTIGLPFLLLGSTSPLLQLWLARQEGAGVPWRLFALSNAGSLLALLLYPAVIEPHFSLSTQRAAWGIGFGVYAILSALISWRLRGGVQSASAAASAAESGPKASRRARLLWFLLPAAAAMQLCAVTSHLSQNIAAIPLLWILPLAVYLLTFILAFDASWLYRRWIVVRLLVVFLAALAYMLSRTDVSLPIQIGIGFFLLELFFACLFCHAETFALRPANPSESTLFYLLIAAGGAAGSIFIGLGCPLLFDANYDVSLAFLATAALALLVTWNSGWGQRMLWSVSTALLLALAIMLHIVYGRNTLVAVRNFYGSLRVRQSYLPAQAGTIRTLTHGTIEHGTQWFAPDFRRVPTTYYATDSGVGLALRNCCGDRPRTIGVVGLGAGTLAAYGKSGDRLRFYEINPAVLPIAQNLFTYIRESGAQISYALGDARLSLSHEPPQHYDVLAIDAFSGDAIPVHLLTTQAMVVYQRQLAPNGILAFHVSNQYLDLVPVVAEIAAAAGMQSRVVDTPSNASRGEYRATWVLVTNNAAFLTQPMIAAMARPIPPRPGLRVWTDDYSSLLPILQWQRPDRQ
ncbi:MAG TPA: fused MFS/spermidine synthase [Acidobacteriaceae bacterium]